MTEKQQKALQTLMEVECQINPKGCEHQWCEARREVAAAFDMEVK